MSYIINDNQFTLYLIILFLLKLMSNNRMFFILVYTYCGLRLNTENTPHRILSISGREYSWCFLSDISFLNYEIFIIYVSPGKFFTIESVSLRYCWENLIVVYYFMNPTCFEMISTCSSFFLLYSTFFSSK